MKKDQVGKEVSTQMTYLSIAVQYKSRVDVRQI
jgi:hypothetical protein